MSEQWYIVIYVHSGEAYSIGTDIADPMPPEFLALPLSESDAIALNTGLGIWDKTLRSVLIVE
jgi:hypothetical protein